MQTQERQCGELSAGGYSFKGDNTLFFYKIVIIYLYKVLKVNYERKYYYDIMRTQKEAYRYNWQVLNQVMSNETVTEPPDEPPVIYVNLPK